MCGMEVKSSISFMCCCSCEHVAERVSHRIDRTEGRKKGNIVQFTDYSPLFAANYSIINGAYLAYLLSKRLPISSGAIRCNCLVCAPLCFVPMEKSIAGKAQRGHHAERLSCRLPWGGRLEVGGANKPGRKKTGC